MELIVASAILYVISGAVGVIVRYGLFIAGMFYLGYKGF